MWLYKKIKYKVPFTIIKKIHALCIYLYVLQHRKVKKFKEQPKLSRGGTEGQL